MTQILTVQSCSCQPPDWNLLKQFLSEQQCASFMAMGQAHCSHGTIIHLYKHLDTRRYLNLDSHGHAYQYRAADRAYRRISREEATAYVFS